MDDKIGILKLGMIYVFGVCFIVDWLLLCLVKRFGRLILDVGIVMFVIDIIFI